MPDKSKKPVHAYFDFPRDPNVIEANRDWKPKGGSPASEDERTDSPPHGIAIGWERIPEELKKKARVGQSKAKPIVVIPHADFKKHTSVTGQSGAGKSVFRDRIFVERVRQHRATFVLSQNMDEYLWLLRLVASQRTPEEVTAKRNVCCINLESSWSVPLNTLRGDDPESAGIRTYDIIEGMWQESGTTFGPLIESGLRALTQTAPRCGLTFAEMPLLLESRALRQRLLPKMDRSSARYFADLDSLTPTQQRVQTAPVLNKLERWLAFSPVRGALSQPESLSWRQLLEEIPDLIVMVNLAKNRYGSASLLVGSLLWESINAELLHESRVNNPSTAEVLLIIDEYQALLKQGDAASRLEHLLAMSRKYGLSLLMLTQIMGLLPPPLRESVRGNTYMSVAFASKPDAGLFADDINLGFDPTRDEIRRSIQFARTGESVVLRGDKPSVYVKHFPPDTPEATKNEALALEESSFRVFARPLGEVEREAEARAGQLLVELSTTGFYDDGPIDSSTEIRRKNL